MENYPKILETCVANLYIYEIDGRDFDIGIFIFPFISFMYIFTTRVSGILGHISSNQIASDMSKTFIRVYIYI